MELIETLLITYGPLISAILAEVALIFGIIVKIKEMFVSFDSYKKEDYARRKETDEKMDVIIRQNAELRDANYKLMEELTKVRTRGNRNDKKN